MGIPSLETLRLSDNSGRNPHIDTIVNNAVAGEMLKGPLGPQE